MEGLTRIYKKDGTTIELDIEHLRITGGDFKSQGLYSSRKIILTESSIDYEFNFDELIMMINHDSKVILYFKDNNNVEMFSPMFNKGEYKGGKLSRDKGIL